MFFYAQKSGLLSESSEEKSNGSLRSIALAALERRITNAKIRHHISMERFGKDDTGILAVTSRTS